MNPIRYIHYIGKHYKNFIQEAKKQGISRNIPSSQAKKIKWGEKVICAKHYSYNSELYDCADTENLAPFGIAQLLCSFQITSVLLKDAQLSQALINDERIKAKTRKTTDHTEGGETPGTKISRHCGTYYIQSSVTVDMEVKDIVEIAEEIAAKHQVQPKLMIGGEIDEIFHDQHLEAMPFRRGLIELEDDDETPKKREVTIHGLSEYKQYHSDHDRFVGKHKTLDKFGVKNGAQKHKKT